LSERVGLLGGTFNPIHNGHMFLAEEAFYQAKLDRLIFLPNRIPPHKDLPEVTAQARFEMLVAATEQIPEFSVSRVELERAGRSYTIDTLESFPEELELVFICGSDAFNADWHRLSDVVARLDTLLIANRAGSPFQVPSQLRGLSENLKKKVQMMDFPDISISSSEIRQRICQGRPYRSLIPEPVYRIISRSGLYASTSTES
jgi:nicotinate-nucleotide adenylyltransferase